MFVPSRVFLYACSDNESYSRGNLWVLGCTRVFLPRLGLYLGDRSSISTPNLEDIVDIVIEKDNFLRKILGNLIYGTIVSSFEIDFACGVIDRHLCEHFQRDGNICA